MSPELTITMETVTPLFLGGADPRGMPELRAPSFRGAMRYWMRAALGGVIGDNDLQALRRLESSVFGSTERGSPIRVRLKPVGGQVRNQDETILPHKAGGGAGSRKAIEAGQRLELTLSMTHGANSETWAAAIAALRLAVTFGGVGLRSRRGYGTLRVSESADQAQMPTSPTSLEGWKNFAKQTAENAIAACRKLAEAHNVSPLLETPSKNLSRFPCANKQSLIMISKVEVSTAMEAVIQFMQKVPKDLAFGGINPRQASPLWVRPIQTENGYRLLFVILASELTKGTDYQKVQKFLNRNFSGEILQAKGWNA